jgi:hypothetical protein
VPSREEADPERIAANAARVKGLASFQDAVFLDMRSSTGIAPLNPWLLLGDAFGIWLILLLIKPNRV